MRARSIRSLTLLACLGASALMGAALAQSSGGDFSITREAIAGGGVRAFGGDYTAITTTAQPVASHAQVGGAFSLRGGFHVPASTAPSGDDHIFENGFEN